MTENRTPSLAIIAGPDYATTDLLTALKDAEWALDVSLDTQQRIHGTQSLTMLRARNHARVAIAEAERRASEIQRGVERAAR